MTARPRHPRPVQALLAMISLGVLLSATGATVAFAAPPPIVLDGDFADWDGRITFSDTPVKDEPLDQKSINFKEDVEYFYYGWNEGQPWLYFRVDRYPQAGGSGKDGIDMPVYYCVYIDYNNSHASPTDRFEGFQDPEDFLLVCAFVPSPDPGVPNTNVYLVHAPDFFFSPGMNVDPAGIIWPTPATPLSECQGDWGQPYVKSTGKGGLWVEFGIPFYAFDPPFAAGETIRFFLGATMNNPLNKIEYPHQDFCPDDFGGITDAPISTLGPVGTILLVAAGLLIAYLSVSRALRIRTASGVVGR